MTLSGSSSSGHSCAFSASHSLMWCANTVTRKHRASVRRTDQPGSAATSSNAHCTAIGSVPACRTARAGRSAGGSAAASTSGPLASTRSFATFSRNRKPSRKVLPTECPSCPARAPRIARCSSSATQSATSAADAGMP